MNFITKNSRYNLLMVFLLGIVVGLKDSSNANPGNLLGSGLGFLIISFSIGISLHGILLLLNFYKKKQHDHSLLDENLDESEKEERKRRMEISQKPFLYTLYISVVFFILFLIG